MAYLIPKDYQVNIQDANLQQIITNDESIRQRAQFAGEAEAQSYLKQKYDISREFQSMEAFVFNKTYVGLQRFYIDAQQYNPASTYNTNDLTLNNGNVYAALSNGITGAFNPSNWLDLGPRYSIFSAVLPYPEFNYGAMYNIGDQVWYKNKTYTCLVQTPLLDHDTALQYNRYENLPLPNVAPDDPIAGLQYWGIGTPYNVTQELPTNETYYAETDTRDAQMVMYCCDIVLYHLHTRIAPRNIPELRVKRYDDAIAWLQMCAKGDITPNLPKLQPTQGGRIRWGSSIRQNNSY